MTDRQPASEQTWEGMFNKWLKHKKRHGPLLKSHQDPPLYNWCNQQRQEYARARGFMSARLLRLEQAGFVFDVRRYRAKEKIRELAEYQNVHGEGAFPQRHDKKHAYLIAFVTRQKKLWREDKLDDEHINELKSVGIDLKPRLTGVGPTRESRVPQSTRENIFWANLKKIEQYQEIHGEGALPKGGSNRPYDPLANWLKRQRIAAKKINYPAKFLKALRDVGVKT